MLAEIVLTPGDGIGPEVVSSAVRVLQAIAGKYGHTFSFHEYPIGGCAIDLAGNPLPDDTLNACLRADAVLLGAVGGPRWDDPQAAVRPEQGLLALRKALGVFANLRPVRPHPALTDRSPLRPERLTGVDLVVVRELTGGLYFGKPKGTDVVDGRTRAVDTLVYYQDEITRIVELAFQMASNRRRKVTSVDKANVLESSRLWRRVATQVSQKYRAVTLEHMLVDTAAMRLVADPASFDVIVTENMFGDILTDEAAVLTGSMGMLPSASLGESGPGVYEPIHGSAPDIAGRGIANPYGTVLSAALLLRYSLHLEEEALKLEKTVFKAINQNALTSDVGGNMSTEEVTNHLVALLTEN